MKKLLTNNLLLASAFCFILTPLFRIELAGLKISPLIFYYLLFYGYLFVNLCKRNAKFNPINVYIVASITYLLWSGISLSWSEKPYVSFWVETVFYSLSSVLMCLTYKPDFKVLEKYMNIAMILMTFLVLYGFVGMLQNDILAYYSLVPDTKESDRIATRNTDAFMIGCFSAFAFGKIYSSKRLTKVWGLGSALVCFSAVVLTASRGMTIWIASTLLFILILAALFSSLRGRVKILMTLVSVSIIPIIILINIFSSTIAYLALRFTQMEASSRFDLAYEALLSYIAHPIMGQGMNNFKIEIQLWTHKELVHAHNIYLDAAANLGTIGFICIFLILFWPLFSLLMMLIRHGRKFNQENQILLLQGIGLAFFMFISAFTHCYYDSVFFWYLNMINILIAQYFLYNYKTLYK